MEKGSIVICINNDKRENCLTMGKEYEVISAQYKMIKILNDENKLFLYYSSRFSDKNEGIKEEIW